MILSMTRMDTPSSKGLRHAASKRTQVLYVEHAPRFDQTDTATEVFSTPRRGFVRAGTSKGVFGVTVRRPAGLGSFAPPGGARALHVRREPRIPVNGRISRGRPLGIATWPAIGATRAAGTREPPSTARAGEKTGQHPSPRPDGRLHRRSTRCRQGEVPGCDTRCRGGGGDPGGRLGPRPARSCGSVADGRSAHSAARKIHACRLRPWRPSFHGGSC